METIECQSFIIRTNVEQGCLMCPALDKHRIHTHKNPCVDDSVKGITHLLGVCQQGKEFKEAAEKKRKEAEEKEFNDALAAEQAHNALIAEAKKIMEGDHADADVRL